MAETTTWLSTYRKKKIWMTIKEATGIQSWGRNRSVVGLTSWPEEEEEEEEEEEDCCDTYNKRNVRRNALSSCRESNLVLSGYGANPIIPTVL
jgi:hypothetical protein